MSITKKEALSTIFGLAAITTAEQALANDINNDVYHAISVGAQVGAIDAGDDDSRATGKLTITDNNRFATSLGVEKGNNGEAFTLGATYRFAPENGIFVTGNYGQNTNEVSIMGQDKDLETEFYGVELGKEFSESNMDIVAGYERIEADGIEGVTRVTGNSEVDTGDRMQYFTNTITQGYEGKDIDMIYAGVVKRFEDGSIKLTGGMNDTNGANGWNASAQGSIDVDGTTRIDLGLIGGGFDSEDIIYATAGVSKQVTDIVDFYLGAYYKDGENGNDFGGFGGLAFNFGGPSEQASKDYSIIYASGRANPLDTLTSNALITDMAKRGDWQKAYTTTNSTKTREQMFPIGTNGSINYGLNNPTNIITIDLADYIQNATGVTEVDVVLNGGNLIYTSSVSGTIVTINITGGIVGGFDVGFTPINGGLIAKGGASKVALNGLAYN